MANGFPEPLGVLQGFNPSDLGSLAALLGQAEIAMEGFQRATFDWSGEEAIPCNASELEEGKELSVGGWELRKKCTISVRVSNLPDPEDLPKTNDTVVLYLSEGATGVKLRILKVKNSYNTVLKLECVDTNHP